MRFKKRILAAGVVAFATLGMLAGTAFASQYEETSTLNHDDYCIGYGWGNSAYGSGVYSGTNWTGGGGPCYRKQDASFHYNTVDNYNPANTGWQTYNLFQGAGPEGSCDWEDTWHYLSWIGSSGDYRSGRTTASDC